MVIICTSCIDMRIVNLPGAPTIPERDPADGVVRVVDAGGGITLLTFNSEDYLVSRTARTVPPSLGNTIWRGTSPLTPAR